MHGAHVSVRRKPVHIRAECVRTNIQACLYEHTSSPYSARSLAVKLLSRWNRPSISPSLHVQHISSRQCASHFRYRPSPTSLSMYTCFTPSAFNNAESYLRLPRAKANFSTDTSRRIRLTNEHRTATTMNLSAYRTTHLLPPPGDANLARINSMLTVLSIAQKKIRTGTIVCLAAKCLANSSCVRSNFLQVECEVRASSLR